ncbi:hypothetical protein EDC01DRAFT_780895 [Geopyxis carbonaria]|nr:hypothetical protein EDC01DRAFT_780895 [Geopyxis carbonaria]
MRFFIAPSLFLTFGLLLVPTLQAPAPESSNKSDYTIDASGTEVQSISNITTDLQDLPIATVDLQNSMDAQARRGSIVCDTTDGSPRLHDIDGVIYALRARGDQWCYQTNTVASKCTTVSSRGSVAISLCGNDKFRARCRAVADMTQAIKDKCKWYMYAGGRNYIEKPALGWRVQLH